MVTTLGPELEAGTGAVVISGETPVGPLGAGASVMVETGTTSCEVKVSQGVSLGAGAAGGGVRVGAGPVGAGPEGEEPEGTLPPAGTVPVVAGPEGAGPVGTPSLPVVIGTTVSEVRVSQGVELPSTGAVPEGTSP